MNEPSATPLLRGELNTIVRQRILSGVYRPGSWIREIELQREFGVSNGPVREALQQAVADGLAERAPFRGVRVIDLSEREVVELFDVRFALLGFAAEQAAANAAPGTAESAAALKAALQADRNAADLWLRGEFSRWVFELAGNTRLRDAYQRPLMQSLVYVAVARSEQISRDTLHVHCVEVIDAIVRGDAGGARRAVRALTEQTLRYLRSTVQLAKEQA